jgi:carbonic anhydrase
MGGVDYALVQLHFHHLSEHTLDGAHMPMEAHFVHRSASGDLLVLGVLIQPGAANPVAGEIWPMIPEEEGETAGAGPVDLSALLPDDRHAYRYQGSLTTPPCSETVTWNVFAAPVTLSPAQIDAFAALYENNARPVQPLNRRYILSDIGR